MSPSIRKWVSCRVAVVIAMAVGLVALAMVSGCDFDTGVGTESPDAEGPASDAVDTATPSDLGDTPALDTGDTAPPTDDAGDTADSARPTDTDGPTDARDSGDTTDTSGVADAADSGDTTDTTGPADTFDSGSATDTADGTGGSDTSDTATTRDASDVAEAGGPSDSGATGDVDTGPCTGAGCPCNYNQLTSGVCGGARTDSSGNCKQPTDFEYAESSCGDNTDNDCDGDTDAADSDCSDKPAGASCSSGSACKSGLCVKESPPIGVSTDYYCAHRIFVTSQSWTGDLGGLSGADTKCKRLANRAKLDGDWNAVVSTSSTFARSHISVGLDRPVHNLDPQSNDRVFSGSGQMWSTIDAPQNPVRYDENGQSVTGGVWTATEGNGATSYDGTTAETCSDWGSASNSDDAAYGDARSNHGTFWIKRGVHSCDQSHHLYCIDGQ